MTKVITAALIAICFLLVGCASMNQFSQQNEPTITPVAEDSYKMLEQKLIQDYLAHAKLDQIQQEEEEVVIYNTRDELEYQGKAQDTNARLMVLKGDFLINMNNMQIYLISK
jgi:PBP1b-binding outer membrane lipoprotein LpoB